MEFLSEMNDAHLVVEEAADGKKQYFIEGIWLQTNMKNRNGRLYPKPMMENEVARYRREMIDKNRAVGEMGHPNTPTINGDRVSHKILSLKEDGDNYIGRARITTHLPMGKVAAGLIDEGIQFGVSSRGMGSIRESNGANVVQHDFHMATAGDIVFDPSAPDAFMTGMMEGKEWVWENGMFLEADLSEAKQMFMKVKKARIEEAALQIMERFLHKL